MYWLENCSAHANMYFDYLRILNFLQALDMIKGKNILALMDSHLEGNFST